MSNQQITSVDPSDTPLATSILQWWNDIMLGEPFDPNRYCDRIQQINYETTRLIALDYRMQYGPVMLISWAKFNRVLNDLFASCRRENKDFPVNPSGKFRRKELIAADLANELKARNLASDQPEFY